MSKNDQRFIQGGGSYQSTRARGCCAGGLGSACGINDTGSCTSAPCGNTGADGFICSPFQVNNKK